MLIDCKCTNCGGILQVDEECNKRFTCPFCNSLFAIQDAKNYYIQNNHFTVFVDKLKLASELEDFEIVGGELVRYIGVGVNIAIPEGVKAIRPNAFANLRAIESVDLPLSCTEIGERAFYNCESLKVVICRIESEIFPPSLHIIGNSAFENCKELRKVKFPIGLSDLGARAFANCSNLFEVDADEYCQLSRIKASTFENCTNLIRVSMVHSVYIEQRAFYNCINLHAANIRPRHIEPYTFYNCQNLASIDLRWLFTSDIKEYRIGNNAFENCYSLQEIDVKNRGSDTIIGREAFKSCKGLQVIKGTSFKFEEGAFSGCECLTELIIEDLYGCQASAKSFEGTPVEALLQERRIKKRCLFCGNKTKLAINKYRKICRKCTVCDDEDEYEGQPYGFHIVLLSLAEETAQYRRDHNLCQFCGHSFFFRKCVCCGKHKNQ